MATPIRIKRRVSGAAGAPATLMNAEQAYNEVDDILYYGKGAGGAGGTATAIVAIAGTGAFASLSGAQTITGLKTFSTLPQSTATPTADEDLTTREWVLSQIGSAGGGTVTSVGVTAPVGFSVTNSPITGAGTIAIGYAAGYRGFTATEGTKLENIQANATANQTDAYLLARGNHTGTQAISTVTGLQTALDGKLETAARGAANGVASLDAAGKLPIAQLPDGVAGGLRYQGTWNASTNSPTIPAAAAANTGHYYIVATAGTTAVDGISDWEVGDWIVSSGAAWSKIDNTDAVTSVNGLRGAVTIDVSDLASAGTMATQNANAVAITGGTIDDITLDGGTF